jgi:UDP-N-acetylmuramate dehydrogenase
MNIEERAELSRFTTLGTGGPARAFARVETLEELLDALRWAGSRGLAVATVGLGSNLLVADEGVDALVLKLAGSLAEVGVDGNRIRAGGGAANAVVLHRAREAGLGGFEFACAIPGTTGGGVWMNAGAYGGDFAQVLERALVVD